MDIAKDFWDMPVKQNPKKNLDIKFSAHDAFLGLSSSGTLKVEILENQKIFYNPWEQYNKGPKQDNQIQPKSYIPKGGDP